MAHLRVGSGVLRTATLLLLPLATLGCGAGPASPPGHLLLPAEAHLDFSWEPDRHGTYREEPVVAVSGGDGTVRIDAELSAPSPCQALSGELGTEGGVLEVRVRISTVGEACVASIGYFRYAATIQGLSAGSYPLRVVHLYPGTGWPSGAVLTTEIEVR
jgi:hypothetical protein